MMHYLLHSPTGDANASTAAPQVQREQIGLYELIKPLHQGGMGVVWRARHVHSGDEVALKTVKATNRLTLLGIRREIQVLSILKHPDVIELLDHGVEQGRPWYAMPFVEGVTLHRLLQKQRSLGDSPTIALATSPIYADTELSMSPASRVGDHVTDETLMVEPEDLTLLDLPLSGVEAIFPPSAPPRGVDADAPDPAFLERHGALIGQLQAIARALAYIHCQGVVHRDLKPANIIIRPNGRPLIVDFGLATLGSRGVDREVLQQLSMPAGSLPYMAPEQFEPFWLDARADLYALGCLLYESLTGRPPFNPREVTEARKMHQQQTPAAPHHVTPSTPRRLEALVMSLLAKQPHDRPGYALDVARALEPFSTPCIPPTKPAGSIYLHRPALVGREDAMARTRTGIERAKTGKNNSLLLVKGAAGVGKTRLAIECSHEATRRGLLVLIGELMPGESPSAPLGVLRNALHPINFVWQEPDALSVDYPEAIRRAAKVISMYDPTIAHLEALQRQPTPVTLPPQESKRRLFEALCLCLEHHASLTKQPITLVFDDLHLVDHTTLEWCAFASKRFHASKGPVMLVGFYREGGACPFLERLAKSDGVRLTTVELLSEPQTAQMIQSMLAISRLPDGIAEFMYRRTLGNPAQIVQLLRAAVTDATLCRDAQGHWRMCDA